MVEDSIPSEPWTSIFAHFNTSACQMTYQQVPWLFQKWKWKWNHCRVRLFVTLWTVAYQAPLSMGVSRQEYWSGLPFPSPKPTIKGQKVGGGLIPWNFCPFSKIVGIFPFVSLWNYPALKTIPYLGASHLLRWSTLCGVCFSQGHSRLLRQATFCLWNVSF